MTEIPPEPHNYEGDEYVLAEDVRHRSDWSEIASLSIDIDSLLLSPVSDLEAYNIVSDKLEELSKRIGENYIDGKAEVKGFARRVEFGEPDASGVETYIASTDLYEIVEEEGEPVVGIYRGVDIHKVDGQWQTLILFDLVFNEDEDISEEETRSGYYGLSPYKLQLVDDEGVRDHIEELFLTIDDERDIDVPSKILKDIGVDTRQLVASDEFLTASPLEQRETLDDVIDRLKSSLSHHIADAEVSVWFTGLYQELSARLGDELVSVDPKEWDSAPHHLLQGVIMGFNYVELIGIPDEKQLTLDDFVSEGAPSMILADEDALYYIPTAEVKDVARTQITEDDDTGGYRPE